MIMDLQVGRVLREVYQKFYLRFVGSTEESSQQFFHQRPNQRPDLEGDCPFFGVDEEDPPDDELLQAQTAWVSNS